MPVPAEVECPKQQNIDPAPLPQSSSEESQLEEGGSNGTASPVEGTVHGEKQQSKLFVGGLADSVNEEKLREAFKSYGIISECKVMKEIAPPHKSRGFGFVTFDGPDCLAKVLNTHKTEPIIIDNKEIDPKEAVPQKKPSNKVKRIFVGGVSSDSVNDDLKNYFEQFGKVTDYQLMYDRNTQRHRGFGFVSFETEEPAEKVCSIQYHDIKGKKVEVKVAQSKEALAMQTGKGRTNNGRNGFGNNYMYPGSFGPSQNQYYPPSPTYAPDYNMAMGGYAAPPFIYNGMRKPMRGGKSQDYPQQFPAYMYGGWAEPNRGFYGPPAYGSMPFMFRGHPGMEIIPTSGVDYMTDQFQGIALGAYPPSPMGQYPPMNHMAGGVGHVSDGNSSSSPPELSPTATSASANTYNAQVPAYTGGTGTQSSYNGTGNGSSTNY
ncbi:RNA-binding protein Musashi homolog 1-like [Halichondria panicea]|uniref:RNA-binding protein Musashi homolog 1-like n=1 Tax=Halichondria panicea TaxID=6063 RepID=UPI00312B4BCD